MVRTRPLRVPSDLRGGDTDPTPACDVRTGELIEEGLSSRILVASRRRLHGQPCWGRTPASPWALGLLGDALTVGCGARTGLLVPPVAPWEQAEEGGALPGFPRECPVDLAAPRDPTAPRSIDGGMFFTVAINAAGRAYLWGLVSRAPAQVFDTPTALDVLGPQRAVSAAGRVACLLAEAGTVSCSVDDRRALRPVPLPGEASAIAASGVSCAVVQGLVHCWDARTLAPRRVPAAVNVRHIAVTETQACAVTESGRVICWAHAEAERSGGTEVAVGCAREVSLGGGHACARTSDGRVVCWGDNSSGQLGQGDVAPRSGLVTVQAPPAVGLTSWSRGSCLRSATGQVWCWGEDLDLDGRGTRGPQPPTRIEALDDAQGLGAGGVVTGVCVGTNCVAGASIDHRCASRGGDGFVCWGNNINSQLGRPGPSVARVMGRLP